MFFGQVGWLAETGRGLRVCNITVSRESVCMCACFFVLHAQACSTLLYLLSRYPGICADIFIG